MCDIPVLEQQLALGGAVLDDAQMLSEIEGLQAPDSQLSLVRVKPPAPEREEVWESYMTTGYVGERRRRRIDPGFELDETGRVRPTDRANRLRALWAARDPQRHSQPSARPQRLDDDDDWW